MPRLSKVIEGCGYNDEQGHAIGFQFEGMPVVMERRRVTVFGAQDEATVARLMQWLTDRLGTAAAGG